MLRMIAATIVLALRSPIWSRRRMALSSTCGPRGDRFPTGTVVIDQAFGHAPMGAAEFRRTASGGGTGR